MGQSKIIVSNPCDRKWDEMEVKNDGRYCGYCKKTVIDFTNWEVEEIKKYLLGKNKSICGHFDSLQAAIKRPNHHQFLVDLYFKTENKIGAPKLKSFLLSMIVILMLIVGCNRPTKKSTESGSPTDPFGHEINDDNTNSDGKGHRIIGAVAAPEIPDEFRIKSDSICDKHGHRKKHENKP